MYGDKKNTTTANTAPENPKDFIRAIHKAAEPLLGVALTISSTYVAQIIGQTEAQFVFLDMEHSPMSPGTMTDLVHAIVSSSRGTMFPLVRIPSQGVEWVKWALDSGAAGIIVPMVNNKAEAEEIVSKALYPPRGKRSFGPARAPWGLPEGPQSGVGAYLQRAMRGEVAILPMIESVDGLANVEEIVSVDGVSGVFVGPWDLRLAMGLNGGHGTEPEFSEALEKIVRVSKQTGKVVGSLGIGVEVAQKFKQQGMDFLIVSVDTAVLQAGINTDVREASKATGSRQRSSS